MVSCAVNKHTYVCGDHTCVDKKEFKDYFAKNLVVEIKTKNSKKKNSFDLVELNMPESINKKKNEPLESPFKILNKKEEKVKLKLEKVKLKKKRKLERNKEKEKIKKEKQFTKLKKINSKQKNKIGLNVKTKDIKPTINKAKTSNKSNIFESVKSKKQTSLCDQMKDCDIDKIAELLIKKGREKNFPNIDSN